MVRETHPLNTWWLSNYRRANTKGGTYCITLVTYNRQRFLWDENVRNVLCEGIKATQATHSLTIDPWVRSSSLYLNILTRCCWVWCPWVMIKRHVTKQCDTELKRDEWMNQSIKTRKKGINPLATAFWEYQIRDERDYENHMDVYITTRWNMG